MTAEIRDLVVICQWCGICYAGNKECLGKGCEDSLPLDIIAIKEGYCKLCRGGKCPPGRRHRYKKK